jgi:hypothetical protein
MRRRRFLVGLAALPAGLTALSAGWAVWLASRNRLVITNESGQFVRSLTVEVSDQIIHFGDLPPGRSASASFGTPADESMFAVRGRLEDGTSIDDSCGYVVWEDYARTFHLAIRPGGEVGCR